MFKAISSVVRGREAERSQIAFLAFLEATNTTRTFPPESSNHIVPKQSHVPVCGGFSLRSAFPACEEVDQETIDLLMREMPAFWNGVSDKIACNLSPHTRHKRPSARSQFSEMDQRFVRRDKDFVDGGGGKEEPVGNAMAMRESTRAYSACAPPPTMAITRSPFRKPVAAVPTSTTSPTISIPGMTESPKSGCFRSIPVAGECRRDSVRLRGRGPGDRAVALEESVLPPA
jgi:hypothetical protein